ncbi:hypothetical protein BDV98DRAFT_564386 [Pterulicium gracile]|uniref:Uncharacterized protein n=1 Tax=Pterulicium gracile TaxID=1884261 RepID=A0A5C3QNM6_9AGAR|nr:hypothetical protein BDV98DRAFT_564386 [Pterula gracilis]
MSSCANLVHTLDLEDNTHVHFLSITRQLCECYNCSDQLCPHCFSVAKCNAVVQSGAKA